MNDVGHSFAREDIEREIVPPSGRGTPPVRRKARRLGRWVLGITALLPLAG
jgi:hypothetical protein